VGKTIRNSSGKGMKGGGMKGGKKC